ncbi:hypothetical protein KAZ57_03205 [Patescibacteria group bacterium]|nr:hypothetical protein [Patescibacteria group bacterium]
MNDRQVRLLNAIITEYIKTAEPVGSVELVKRYNLRYSPATARNEMARLLEQGFLEMLHTSSGRVPTPQAYRYFLQELLEEVELPVLQEVAMKQRLWGDRFDVDKLIRNAVITLAEQVHELAIALTDDNYLVSSGAVNILDHKEFWDIDAAKTALYLLDRPEVLRELFEKSSLGEEVISLIGKELGIENLSGCCLLYTRFNTGKKGGYVAVFGPVRMRYDQIIPAVRYTKNLIQELGESW